jgi:hypothetical protein
VAGQAREYGAQMAEAARWSAAELGDQVRELTVYTELAEMADQVRAENDAAERRELAAHVAELAAHARTSARTTPGTVRTAGAQAAVRARTMRALTPGPARTQESRAQESESRADRAEFVGWLVEAMRANPDWAPDYAALEARTNYRLRWLQMRVTEARAIVADSSDDEEGVTDAEIIEESAA